MSAQYVAHVDRMSESDRNNWFIGLVMAALFVAGLVFLSSHPDPNGPPEGCYTSPDQSMELVCP